MRVLICIISLMLLIEDVLGCIPNISKIKAKAVYGRVVDKYENPISKASVLIYEPTDDGEKIIAETKTNDDGHFEITNIVNGKYAIKANAENFTYSYANLKLAKSSKKVREEELVFVLVTYGECSGDVEIRKIVKPS